MGLRAEMQQLTCPAATGNQTYSLLDTGFGQVKAILVWSGGVASDQADTSGDWRLCFGAGTYRGAAAQQFVIISQSANGQANSVCARGQQSNAIARLYSNSTTPTILFSAALVSLGDAQFVLNWTVVSSGMRVHVLALGGEDITDALVSSYTWTNPASNDTKDVTVATGFGQPDLIIAATASSGDADTPNGSLQWNIGAGLPVRPGAAAAVRCTSHGETHNAANMTVQEAQESVFLDVSGSGGGSFTYQNVLSAKSAWPVDGFQVSVPVGATFVNAVKYLALKGRFTAKLGAGNAPTAAPTVTQDIDIGQPPRAAFFFHNSLITTAGIDTTSARLGTTGLGAGDGTRHGWAGAQEDDANATSQTNRHTSNSKAIRMYSIAAAGTLESEATLSFVGTAARLTWADTDSAAVEYNYLVLGDAPPRTPAHDYLDPALI